MDGDRLTAALDLVSRTLTRAGRLRSALLHGAMALTLLAAFTPWTADASCSPPLSSCPAQPGRPVAAITAPSDVGPRSATLNGMINPEGAATSYHWVYADASGRYLGNATPTQTLPAGYSNQSISTPISGLRPGVSYTITLYASNSQGDVSTTRQSAFRTTSHPILSLAVSRRAIVIAKPFQVTVRVRGAYDPYGSVQIYIAKAPYRHWVKSGESGIQRDGRLTVDPCPAFSQLDGGCPWLDRNFEVRAQMGSARSRVVRVYVYPYIVLITKRENYNASAFLDLTYSAIVHRTKGRYPDELVYFYSRPGRRGPFTRIATARLHPHRSYDSEQLLATARIFKPGSVYTLACIRHQLFRDMGRTYTNRRCGSPQLATLKLSRRR